MSAGRRKGQKVGPQYGALAKGRGPGAWLYQARLEANLTIDALAAKAHVSRRTILRIENGEPVPVRRPRCRRYSESALRRALGLLDGI